MTEVGLGEPHANACSSGKSDRYFTTETVSGVSYSVGVDMYLSCTLFIGFRVATIESLTEAHRMACHPSSTEKTSRKDPPPLMEACSATNEQIMGTCFQVKLGGVATPSLYDMIFDCHSDLTALSLHLLLTPSLILQYFPDFTTILSCIVSPPFLTQSSRRYRLTTNFI
jgi:hypothetical protein